MHCSQRQSPARRHIGMLAAVIALPLAVSACADNPVRAKDPSPHALHAARLVTAMSLGASSCGSYAPNPTPDDVTIKVYFRTGSAGKLCPYQVDDSCAMAFKSKKITWKAVDSGGNPLATQKFQVFFDPIQGSPIKITGSQTKPIDDAAPDVVYKYTVWDWPQGSDPHACEPLDPNFRVHQ